MPCDLGDGTLDGVGVLEDHHSLCCDWLRHEFGIFTVEVFFKEINLVVLLNTARCSLNELTSGLSEAKSGLLGQLSHILVDLVGLLVVVLLGPTTDTVVHTVVLSGHSLSVDLKSKTN